MKCVRIFPKTSTETPTHAQEILYIGDDIGEDVKPAKQVGVQAGLMWKKSDEADYSFEKFENILEVLKK